MKLRRLLASAAIALTAVVLCAPASAQVSNYDRIISFGDSLSDNGNTFALSGGAIPSSPYYGGRFSNGPTWVELLSGGQSQPVFGGSTDGSSNYAFGGARTDVLAPLNNVPQLSGSQAEALGLPDEAINFPPGVPSQVDLFLLRDGTVGPNDLFTVWAGANDIFDLLDYSSGGTNDSDLPDSAIEPTPETISGTAVTAASNVVGQVQRLTGLGAQTILVANLPNLGATPGFNTDPTSSGAGLLASSVFNFSLHSGLNTLAAQAPGVNIVEMDVFSAFNVILKNPDAFGFTNVTTACIADVSCLNGSLAEQNSYLFWDGVHPTEAGHILLAQYANLLLSTGEIAPVVAPLVEVGLNSRMDASDGAFNRALDLQDGYERSGLYAQIIGNRFSTDANGSTPAFDYDLFGARGGLDMRSGSFSYGLAFGYQTGELKEAALTADVSTVQADIHATAHLGTWFLTAQGGYSHTAFDDISRATGFGPVKANADAAGDQLSAALGAGKSFRFGSFVLTPGARVGYVTSNVGAFAETADVLALQYDGRDVASGFWDARLRASTNLGQNGGKLKAFVEAGYQDFFATETDAITAKLVNNTALPVTVAADDPGARGAFVKLGIDAALASGMTLSAEYALSVHEEGGENHAGMVQVKIPLSGAAGR